VTRRYLKAEQWRELIAQQAAGTESIVDFCRRHGLSTKSFYHRRKAFRDADEHQGMVAVAPPLVRPSSGPMAVSWCGVELALPASASPAWVAQLMKELASASVS
jgi:hypothetical protein